jgi:hypothetical protein
MRNEYMYVFCSKGEGITSKENKNVKTGEGRI